MEKRIPALRNTPFVHIREGEIIFRGRCIPEDPNIFFRPLLNDIKEYCQHKFLKTHVIMDLEYINTSSTRWLVDLLSELHKCKQEILVEWYYEFGDEDMMDLGKIIQSVVKVPFRFEEIPE